MLSTLANRLLRLDKQINEYEKNAFAQHAQGKSISKVVQELLHVYDPDVVNGIEQKVAREMQGASPADIQAAFQEQHQALVEQAVAVFHQPELRTFIVEVRRKYDQIIDTVNQDTVTKSAWVKDLQADAEQTVQDFRTWIETHKDEITALQIFYGQPYQRRDLTYRMMKELAERLTLDKPVLAPCACGRRTNNSKMRAGKTKW
jgi:type I restriction enzyme R subunit